MRRRNSADGAFPVTPPTLLGSPPRKERVGTHPPQKAVDTSNKSRAHAKQEPERHSVLHVAHIQVDPFTLCPMSLYFFALRLYCPRNDSVGYLHSKERCKHRLRPISAISYKPFYDARELRHLLAGRVITVLWWALTFYLPFPAH